MDNIVSIHKSKSFRH